MKIGVLGLGKISRRVIQGILYSEEGELYAVASRDLAKAQAYQKEFHAEKAYDSYEALCQDEKVELIYICTPNPLHKEHILLCLAHHKHVICEKPMVTKRADLQACFAYARQQHCFLMEAHKTVCTPLNQTLMQMIREGAIGNLQMIDARYCSYLDVETSGISSWCLTRDGGCFYDIGVYPVAYANAFAQSDITDMQVSKRRSAQGYISQAQALLKYANGIMAHVVSSWDCDMENKGYLYGDKGYIVCENFWKNTVAYLVRDGDRKSVV